MHIPGNSLLASFVSECFRRAICRMLPRRRTWGPLVAILHWSRIWWCVVQATFCSRRVFSIASRRNVFAGCSLDAVIEVHLLRFYIETRFEDACPRQQFVNVVLSFQVCVQKSQRICRMLPRPRDPELEVHLLRFRLGFRFEDACSRQHILVLVCLGRFQEMHLPDASRTQKLWSTWCDFTLNSELKMHTPGTFC